MTPRLRALLVLVAALGLARAVVSALERPAAAVTEVLAAFAPGDVARIVLARGDHRLTLERAPLERAASGWVVRTQDGAALPARPGADDLVEHVLGWRRDRLAGADPADHAAWCVSDALGRGLRLEDAQGHALADLLVGAIAGIEPEDVREQGSSLDTTRLGLFVRSRGEDATWVVTDFFTRELEPEPRGWYDHALPRARPEDVRVLAVGGGDAAPVVLARDEAGGLRLEGDQRPVDGGRWHAALTWLLALDTLGPADPADLGPGALELQLTLASGQRARARLGPARGAADGVARWVLAPEGGQAVEVAALPASRFAQQVARGFVRGVVFFWRPEDVTRLAWGPAAGETVLERREAGWTLLAPGAPRRAVEADAVGAALAPLLGLVPAWDVDGTAAQAFRAAQRVTVDGPEGERVELLVGARPDASSRSPARVSSATLPFWLDADAVEAILERLGRLAHAP